MTFLRRSPRLQNKNNTVKQPSINKKRPYKDISQTSMEEEAEKYQNSLTEEDKEYQAIFMMTCISNNIPYTTAMFERYRDIMREYSRVSS